MLETSSSPNARSTRAPVSRETPTTAWESGECCKNSHEYGRFSGRTLQLAVLPLQVEGRILGR
jgi:hypothetical protein